MSELNTVTESKAVAVWSNKSGKTINAYTDVAAQRAPLAVRQVAVASVAVIKAAENGHWGAILTQIRNDFDARLPARYQDALRASIRTTLIQTAKNAQNDKDALRATQAALAVPDKGLPLSNDVVTAHAFFNALMGLSPLGKAKSLPVCIRDAQVYGVALGFAAQVADAAQ